MTEAWKMTWTELKLFLRDPMAAFFTLVFPLMMLFLFGSIFGNEPDPQLGGRGQVDVSVPGYIAVIIATTAIMGLPINLASYRAGGVLRRFRATPLRPSVVLGSQVAVGALFTTLGAGLLLVAGRVVFGLRLPDRPAAALAAFLLGAAGIYAFGFILASILPNARTAQSVGMVVLFPMMFLSGAALPRPLLPESIQDVGRALPLSHVVTLLDGAWSGAGWNWPAALVLTGVMAVGTGLSALLFRWE
ncbi:MAG: ABC transporter permease [Acidimicrobiales bacterium]